MLLYPQRVYLFKVHFSHNLTLWAVVMVFGRTDGRTEDEVTSSPTYDSKTQKPLENSHFSTLNLR